MSFSHCRINRLTVSFYAAEYAGLTRNTPWVYTDAMSHIKHNNKRQAVRRLKIISGQIRGLEKMVSEDKYCIDIIHQSLAIKRALSGVEDLILENHLATHVVEQMKTNQKSKAIQEILSIYKLSKQK